MKLTKLRSEIKSLHIADLRRHADEARRELFTLRLNAATAHIKDYSQVNKLRRQIARILTQIRSIEQV